MQSSAHHILGRGRAIGPAHSAAPSWPNASSSRTSVLMAAARGRPRKVLTDEEQAVKRARLAGGKKRGPKPTTSADHLKLLDPQVLEEFKQTAAQEEAARQGLPEDPEANPARFNFHRVLMNAASRGLPEQAEAVLGQLEEAGLPPGPRAYHGLVFSYVRSKLPYEALDAAKRAVEQGLLLRPETFVVLIFSLLNHPDEPDVESAQQVLESMEAQEQSAGGSAQLGWLMLCKELFRKGLIADAMTAVKRGYDAHGYASDLELGGRVIEQLAKAGLKDRAYQEVEALVALGYTPGPAQYNHLIKAEAAVGSWRRARYLLLDAFAKPTWAPPNVDSFNALLQGIVISVDPETGLPTGPGVDTDVGIRLGDVQTVQAPTTAGPDAARQALVAQLGRVREEMLVAGLRPNAESYAAMCAGYIKLAAIDEALGAFQAMVEGGGSTALLSKKRLSSLLVQLAELDRPADLLNVLKALVASNQRLPRSAAATLDHVSPGATLTTAWLPAHFEYMRAHPDDGTGRGTSGTAAGASLRAMLEQAVEIKEHDGVALSELGGCAVEEDGGGVWLKPSRMSLAQLGAELGAAGLEAPEGAKRSALVAMVKERREGLPRVVKEVQAHLEAAQKAELEALERKAGIKLSETQRKGKGKKQIKTFRVLQMQDGQLAKIQIITQEVAKRKGGFTVERGGSDPYGVGDALGEEGGPRERGDDEDELGDILKDGVDEGVGDILRDEDTVFGEAGEGPASDAADQTDSLDITIDVIEARLLNRTAGMRVALEVLRCVEMLGGEPTGPDYEALVAGVVAEANADVALEMADRLPHMLRLGYSQEAVAGLYEQLARVCLGVLRGGTADLVLERAEDLQLTLDPALYAMLSKALGGRPRHRQLAAEELEDLTDGGSVDLLSAEDEELAFIEDVEGGEEGGRQGSTGGAGGPEEEEEEEEGVYGRAPPTAAPSALPTVPEDASSVPLGSDPSWQADQAAARDDEEDGPAAVSIGLLAALADGTGSGPPPELVDAMTVLASATLPALTPRGPVQLPGAQPDGSVALDDGVVVSVDQMAALSAAVSRGAGGVEALLEAGLLSKREAAELVEMLGGVDLLGADVLLPGAAGEDEESTAAGDDDGAQALDDLQALLGGETLGRVVGMQAEISDLEDALAAGQYGEDTDAATVAAARLEELRAGLQADLAPRFATLLSAGVNPDHLDALIAEGDVQLADEASYAEASRALYLRQAAALGVQPEAAEAAWHATPTLHDLASRPDQPLLQILERLSQAPDSDTLLQQLADLEDRVATTGLTDS